MTMGEQPPTIGDGGTGVYARIEAALIAQNVRLADMEKAQNQRLDRIEDKLDSRMTTLDEKVDRLGSRQDRLEGKLDGTLSIIKWLGPAGVMALLFGLFILYGLFPLDRLVAG